MDGADYTDFTGLYFLSKKHVIIQLPFKINTVVTIAMDNHATLYH